MLAIRIIVAKKAAVVGGAEYEVVDLIYCSVRFHNVKLAKLKRTGQSRQIVVKKHPSSLSLPGYDIRGFDQFVVVGGVGRKKWNSIQEEVRLRRLKSRRAQQFLYCSREVGRAKDLSHLVRHASQVSGFEFATQLTTGACPAASQRLGFLYQEFKQLPPVRKTRRTGQAGAGEKDTAPFQDSLHQFFGYGHLFFTVSYDTVPCPQPQANVVRESGCRSDAWSVRRPDASRSDYRG